MTVLETDYLPSESGASPLSKMPFGLLLDALDDLKPGEIYMSSGGSPRYALWGGLMTTRHEAGSRWRHRQRLFARHARDSGLGFSRLLLWVIRPGSGAAAK
ncbi:MAG: hypothetical protein R2911_05085 [Caldilineaceae bacterium]